LAGSFGQQAAILAGLKHARGEAVVTMDTDLHRSWSRQRRMRPLSFGA